MQLNTYTTSPEWAGPIRVFFLLYMFPKGTPPGVSTIETTFSGIFTAFSNAPREYVVVVYDASNLPKETVLTGGNYTHPPKVRFIASQDQPTYLFYTTVLRNLGVTMGFQPSQFVRSSIFAQDPAKFSKLGSGRAILGPQITPQQSLTYAWAGEAVGASTQMPYSFAPLYFEGGNILQGDGFLLAGRNLTANPSDLPGTGNGAGGAQALSALYGGIPVIGLGVDSLFPTSPDFWQSGHQPSFHIDNLVTPLGPLKNPSTGNMEMVFLTAEFQTAGPLDKSGLALLTQMNEAMETIVGQLTAQPLGGLPVTTVTVPSLLVSNGVYGPYMLSWNNCIIENTGQSLTAYLPVYTNADATVQQQINTIVNEVTAVYAQWDASLVWVDNSFASYCDTERGSLHCMVCAIVR
jgi:hypothetical protein